MTQRPKDVDDVTLAFPADIMGLMPTMSDIPDEFKRWPGTRWNKIQQRWFFKGLPKGTEFKPKDGVDVIKAVRHLAAIQGSFEPKHEHKEAAVSFLMSEWFDDIVITE